MPLGDKCLKTNKTRKYNHELPVIGVMKFLSSQYPRFGCRRIRIVLAREGLHLHKEGFSRLWDHAGLQAPAKTGAEPLPALYRGKDARSTQSQNGTSESFNDKLRDEWLSIEWF
ncbi:MAG: hypothetical protein ACK4FF_10450 [Limnobacter sp.]|uniref:hypothetical protein n=1 Tax=Limnobacter sp. TaxID=2003368 RepID=UPI00391A8138